MTRVTVLVPTHDHGRLIRHTLRSVVQQTLEDWELFVVGDGAPPETEEVVRAMGSEDPRIRWFGFEKGPRHGEVHRGTALREATGDVIAFLSDDDLYLPDHLERMVELLADCDLAHSPGCARLPDGSYRIWPIDLSRAFYRGLGEELVAGSPRPTGFPHSFGVLRRKLYDRVPGGLTTTPDGIPTDVYFWNRCLAVDGVRCRAGATPTVLLLESTQRTHMSLAERDAEAAALVEQLADPLWRAEFDRGIAELAIRRMNELDEQVSRIQRSWLWRLRERLRGRPQSPRYPAR